jgi:uncharacterized membrane protein (UPF0127 family)
MHALNMRNGEKLSFNVEVADKIFRRMKGLLGRDKLAKGESLWIKPCNSVHTFGMRFPIDVLFMDKENIVVSVRAGLAPYRLSRLFFRAASVLELPEGTLAAKDTRVGDRIEIA